jgi:hypothetical protein
MYYRWSKDVLEAGKKRLGEEPELAVRRALAEIKVSRTIFYRWDITDTRYWHIQQSSVTSQSPGKTVAPFQA